MIDVFEKLDGGPLGQHVERAHGYFAFPKLEGELGSRMLFRGKEKKYKANSIKGYSKSGIVNYLSIRDLNEGPFFAKILVSGTVSLLASIVQTGASTGKGMDARMFLIHSNKSKTHEVFSMEFKSDLSDYFSDYSELKQQILNKELRYADLEIIVNKYNKWYLKNNYPSENQIIK